MTDRGLRGFLKTWVVPPGFAAARRRRIVPRIQKFWTGAPLPAPPRESGDFSRAGLAAQTITRRDDSRPAALVAARAALPLPPDSRGETVQVAITADAVWPEAARVRLIVGGRTTSQVGLSAAQWLDVRLDVPEGADVLEVQTDAPIHVSAPRAARVSRPSAAGSVRHVVVLVLDAWTPRLASARHPTEPEVPLTPNIERFFSGGFSAPLGYSSGEWTMPTSASFFTGLCTARHQVFHPYADTVLPSGRRLLAEYFQDAGFHTLAMSAANRLTPAYGHHRGFDRFIYHFPEPGFTEVRYDTAVWIAELLGHLDAHRHDRTFSYVHLPDVHPVWEIPPLTRSFNLGRRGSSTGLDLPRLRRAEDPAGQGRQLYGLRLHEIDRLLGGVFDWIDRNAAGETLVALTADHGTPWHYLRRERPKEEPYLVDDRTAVAFMMRGPGVPASTRGGLTAPTLDLMPTLLRRAGLEPPADLDGFDLLDDRYHRDHVISEALYGGVYEIAVRDGRRIYIERYPMAEHAPARLTGPLQFRGVFAAGADDYRTPLAEEPGRLGDIARAHVERYLKGAAA